MVDIKLKKPGVGFYLLAVSTLLSIAAFVLYSLTYDALGYASDKWVIALMIIAFWCFGCLMLTTLISGNATKITDVLYWVAVIALTLATFKFIIPCLSPIGIYFTVHNMGDVEANSIGVPRSIAGIILFVFAIVVLIVSAFFSGALKDKKKVVQEVAEEAVSTKLCASCGAEIVSYAKFCDKCGAAVIAEEQDTVAKESDIDEKSEVDHAE